jgi:hypothetical protein
MAVVTLKNNNGVLAYFVDGVETDQVTALGVAATDPTVVAGKNRRNLLDKFANWIADNKTYIAAAQGATTNARLNDLEAQVKKLSRENLALMRIVGKTLDDVSE